MNVTTILASDWYQNLMQYIPDGKLFSLRSVFDGIPRIVQQLPTTLMLTVFGAFFGIMLALVFAIVKINRVRFIYPLQAFFCKFLKRNSNFSPTDVDLLWDSISSEGLESTMGNFSEH